MQRGIYVWMTPEEVAAEQQGLTEATAQAGAGGKNLDVLLELHRLQNQKSGWGSMIVLLLVSLGLFIGAGARQWQWNYLFILLGVLFVHELGHYLAMRAFNYRNVRMFFIPFFGAAVSGQNHNVPGWKKVMVSLMGPVPGIVLGVILGVAGIALHQPILIKIAIVSLLLNGFNLLPVLPLDGGWVFHTLLFSRHYVLDAGFRVLAAVALIVGGPLIGARILMYLGILMLIGVPASYRMARIAADLRERGLPPVPPDEQTIPAETAQKIIAEVKQAATKPQSNKMVAQQALQIFETLNARPPGWAATIGLLFAHGASFAMAAVFALAFVIAQRGDLRDLIANAAQMPKHKLICGSTQVWGSRQAGPDSAPQITVIATFARRTEAATVFQDLTNRIPATASLERFGDSLLLSLPPDDDALRKKWVDDLQARTKDVFVDSTNFPASFSLVCIAPDKKTAEAITGELEGYFNTLPNLALVPPWLPKDGRSTAERAQHDLARQTYLKLQKAESAGYDDAALKDLQSKIAIARKQGGQAEVKALRDQINERVQSLAQTNIARAGTGTGGAVDARVVELFARLSASATGTNGPDQGIQLELAQRMGQLAVVNGTVDKRYAARFGVAAQNGLLIKVPWVSFECIDTGPAALADWLCGKGCVDLKYDFQSGAAWADEAPE
jgi:Zn-dependent protease